MVFVRNSVLVMVCVWRCLLVGWCIGCLLGWVLLSGGLFGVVGFDVFSGLIADFEFRWYFVYVGCL